MWLPPLTTFSLHGALFLCLSRRRMADWAFTWDLPFWGDFCFVFLLNVLVTHDAQPHMEKKCMFNILEGYPQARMCVWAEQEESYFWSLCSSPAYLWLSAQVNSCCGMNAEDTGFKLRLGNTLRLILFLFKFIMSFQALLSLLIANITMPVCGWGEQQCSI